MPGTSHVEIGVYKRKPKSLAKRSERLQRDHNTLSRVLNMHITIAFAGAGCSAALGYPRWKEFADRTLEFTIAEVEKRGNRFDPPIDLERIKEFRQHFATRPKDTITPERVLFMLGICKNTLEFIGAQSSYYDFLPDAFARPSKETNAPNPYEELLKLPIYRFITT